MKRLGNTLTVVGILLIVYSIIGKFVGKPTIGMGFIELHAISGVIMAIAIMVIGISVKLWDK